MLASVQIQRLRQSVKANVAVYVHHRVYSELKDLLLHGTMTAGDPLPTPGQMAQFLHVGHQTVRTALHRLVDDGLVIFKPDQKLFAAATTGTNVSSPQPAAEHPGVSEIER